MAIRTRDRDSRRRAEGIREAARGWLLFWKGRLDLDLLAWELDEILDVVDVAGGTQAAASAKAVGIRNGSWPGDLLPSIPGIGPICAAATQARWADAELFSPKAAAAFFGLNPSRWESGLTAWPSRPITKGLSVEDDLTKLTQLRAAVCSLRPVRGSEAETAWRLNALGSPRRNGGFKSQSYGDSASISAARTAVRT